MKNRSILVLITALLVLSVIPAVAAEPETGEPQEQSADAAKQARIDEYLRKKEEKKARKESKKAGKDVKAPAPAAAPRTKPEEKEKSGWFSRRKDRRMEQPSGKGTTRRARRASGGTPGGRTGAGRSLDQVLGRLRNSAIMQQEYGAAHMAAMDRGASSTEMAAFGSYLAEQGYLPASVALYREATRAEPDNTDLWLNLGTAQLRYGQVDDAGRSFQKAIRLDPNNAKAHYNLGAVYARSNYDKAIQEFATALTLDPSLGDPAVNPQAANNDLLVPVKMMLYQSQEGSVALPLVPVEEDRAAR